MDTSSHNQFQQVKSDASVFIHGGGTFRISDLNLLFSHFISNYLDKLNEYMRSKGKGAIWKGLLTESGSDGEILEIGSQEWIKGKVRIKVTVEYQSDDIHQENVFVQEIQDSTLDEIRQMTVE